MCEREQSKWGVILENPLLKYYWCASASSLAMWRNDDGQVGADTQNVQFCALANSCRWSIKNWFLNWSDLCVLFESGILWIFQRLMLVNGNIEMLIYPASFCLNTFPFVGTSTIKFSVKNIWEILEVDTLEYSKGDEVTKSFSLSETDNNGITVDNPQISSIHNTDKEYPLPFRIYWFPLVISSSALSGAVSW